MTKTFVDLANNALKRAGQQSISSFEESSEEAKVCASLCHSILATLLSGTIGHTWTWARRVASGVSTTSEHPRWRYAYVLPSDLVKIVEVLDPTQPKCAYQPERQLLERRYPFTVGMEGTGSAIKRVLLCQLSPVSLTYISNAVPLDLWPQAFTRAYEFALAREISIDLGQNPSLTAALENQAAQALEAAYEADRTTQNMTSEHMPDWVRARFGFCAPHAFEHCFSWADPALKSEMITGKFARSLAPLSTTPAPQAQQRHATGIPRAQRHPLVDEYIPTPLPDARIGTLTIGVSPIDWRRKHHPGLDNASNPDGSGEIEQ